MTNPPNGLILVLMSKRTFYNRNTIAKKNKQLGMSTSKARTILVKKIIRTFFSQEHGAPFCYRCGEEISGLSFHIDHKIPWLDSGMEHVLYFDVDNITLSHPLCNSLASRRIKLSDEQRKLKRKLRNKKHRAILWMKKKLLKKSGA
jgi:hypothetical protein